MTTDRASAGTPRGRRPAAGRPTWRAPDPTHRIARTGALLSQGMMGDGHTALAGVGRWTTASRKTRSTDQ